MTNERKKTRKPRAPRGAEVPAPPAEVIEQSPETYAADAAEPDTASRAESVAEEPVVTVDDLVPPADATPADATASDADQPAGTPEDPPASPFLKAIVEALIYASPEPLPLKSLYKVLDNEPREDVSRAVEALRQEYQQVRGLQLVEIAGGLQIVTRPDLHEYVRRLFHERKNTRLSVQSLETLAVIAYRQPVTAAEIAEIRGVNTSGVLATLIERKLVKTAGRKPVVGRPFLYATTREFLLRFGLNDLSDLPKVDDLADVLGFELPGLLNEPLPVDQMLPLDGPDDAGSAPGTDTADAKLDAPVAAGPPPAAGAGETPETDAAEEALDAGERPAHTDDGVFGPEGPEPEPDPADAMGVAADPDDATAPETEPEE